MLPTASLDEGSFKSQPPLDPSDGDTQQIEPSEEWRPLLVRFARLLWSMDTVGSLRLLISNHAGSAVFARWLYESTSRQLREDAMTLEFVQLVQHLQQRPDWQCVLILQKRPPSQTPFSNLHPPASLIPHHVSPHHVPSRANESQPPSASSPLTQVPPQSNQTLLPAAWL